LSVATARTAARLSTSFPVAKILRIDRDCDAALDGAPKRPRQLAFRCREYHNRLANQRTIASARRVDVALSREFRISSHQAACEEAPDVEFLPSLKVVAHHHGDFGIETHDP